MSPRSVRFDESVSERLAAFVARTPGMSVSSATNQFVDEALRMTEHPGVYFRDGATGRRAVLIGGPDVREIVRALVSARTASPSSDPEAVVRLVVKNTGLDRHLLDAAIAYWADYPVEIDRWLEQVEHVEDELRAAFQRRQQLLGA